jgi:hypothetical protein
MVVKSVSICIGSIIVIGLLASCATEKKATEAPPQAQIDPCKPSVMVTNNQAPKWLTQKGVAFSGEKAVLYGVGSIDNVYNAALKRRAAEQSARQEIAATLDTYVANLHKQYLASISNGPDKAGEEQHIEDVLKTITEASLHGADIVEYWENPCVNHNDSYALARLDMDRFMEAMEKVTNGNKQYKELDAQIKQQIQEHSKEAQAQLNDELDKKHQAETK